MVQAGCECCLRWKVTLLQTQWLMCVPGADSCVSCSPSQFHNKVTCFMLQQIEEPCSLGAHAGVIVPPSWIIKVRKPQVQQALSN